MSEHRPVSRRGFLQTSAAAAAVTLTGPAFVRGSDKAGTKPRVGEGDHVFECHHNWGDLPDGWRWGATHGVCIDPEGLVYVTHQLSTGEPQDAVAVFEPGGRFVRSFGRQFHGGGHGLDLRVEGGTPYLYLSDIKNCVVAKLTLTGDEVWRTGVPVESGVYASGAKYVPTNVAFAPDGGLFIADGYGSSYIHRYDADLKYAETFGGTGTEAGKYRTPHGVYWDDRDGREAALVVTDRANARLQAVSPAGKPLAVIPDMALPCDADAHDGLLVVADLNARVTLLDRENNIIVHLGDDPAWTEQVNAGGRKLRSQPERFQPGRFVHPHGACFDTEGNIYVAEWVEHGRLSFLKRV